MKCIDPLRASLTDNLCSVEWNSLYNFGNMHYEDHNIFL